MEPGRELRHALYHIDYVLNVTLGDKCVDVYVAKEFTNEKAVNALAKQYGYKCFIHIEENK